MATINASIKMQDLASNTLESVGIQVDAVEQTLLDLQDTATKLSATDPLHSMVDGAQDAISKFRDLENELNLAHNDVKKINIQQQELVNKIGQAGRKYGQNSTQVQKLKAQHDRLLISKDQLFSKQEQIEKSLIRQGNEAKRLSENVEGAISPTGKWGSAMDGIGVKIIAINQGLQLAKQIAGGIASAMEAVDNYTLTNARLSSVNDGLQTQSELQDKIYASAERSRTSYAETADIVSKLGRSASNVLKSNDSQIAFAELLGKSFKISGADDTAVSSAMYNLNQAMSSGVLQGNDFKAITDNAPMLADSIADYMGVTRAELKKLSSQGQITADIVTNALFDSAKDINEEFEKLPKTFADASNSIKNNATKSFQPVLEMISQMLNSEGFMMFTNTVITGVALVASIIIPILQSIFWVFEQIGNVFMWLGGIILDYSPLILTALALIGAYMLFSMLPTLVYMVYYYTVLGIQALIAGAQMAMAWIIGLGPVGLVIAAILGIVALVRMMAGSFEKAGEIIGGVFGYLGAFAYNVFVVPLWNYIAAFANFFGNVFNDPVYSIKKLFVDVFSTVLDIVKNVAKAIDFVLGTDMGSAVGGFQDDMYKWLGESDKYQNVMENLEPLDYADAWDYGSKVGGSIGAGIDDAVSGLQGMLSGIGSGKSNPIDTSFGDMSSQFDKLMSPGGPGIPTTVKGGKLDVDISEENLKYLRDVAEQEYILKYKQISPNVTLNVGDINEANDGKQLIDELQDMLERELADKYVEEIA